MAEKKKKGNMMLAGNADAFDLDAAAEAAAARIEAIRDGGAADASTSTTMADSDAVGVGPDNVESASDTHSVHTASTPNGDSMRSETHEAHSVPTTSQDVHSTPARSKRRVNITLSADVHDAMKRAASRYGTNVSELCLNGWLAIKDRYGE